MPERARAKRRCEPAIRLRAAVSKLGTSGLDWLERRIMLSAVSFDLPPEYATGANPYAIVTADFNGDHKVDIAAADYGADMVSILINQGAGKFAAKVDYPTKS